MEANIDIELYNRYGEKYSLHYIDTYNGNKRYILEGKLDYCRIVYDNASQTEIFAIDPCGGPFMAKDNFSIDNGILVLDNIVEESSGKFVLSFRNV